MLNIYTPCLCGSGKKFKFCCYEIQKQGGIIPATIECCKFPIHECKILKNWEELGISSIHISRKFTNDSYLFVSYLVDFLCLGLKDSLVKFGLLKRDLSDIYSQSEELINISYQDARSLILGAIDFAKSIDIDPHASWNGISSSFIEGHLPYEKKFSFGLEGKHHYISGPNDFALYYVEEIVKKVSKAQGYSTVYVSAYLKKGTHMF